MPRTPHGKLDGLVVFAAVADSGSFTAAADRLGMTKASVSQQVGRLEAHLGISLFSRTTRQVRLTDPGRTLYEEVAPALRTLQDALVQAGSVDSRLSGTIRLTAPVDHATQSVTPAIAEFARQHPQVVFDLHTSDRVVDLVAEGIDLAIRLGALRDSSLRASKLGSFEQRVAASPAYLRRYGVPATPADLATHQWIEFSLMRTPLTWTFVSGNQEAVRVRMKACMRVDSSASLRSLLLHGAGISVIDQFSVEEAIRSGALVHVLPDWFLPPGGVYAVLPPGRHTPANVRAFIDFYRAYLGRPDSRGGR